MLLKKVIVLGSEGFIGSHLFSYFKQKGYRVFRADIVLKESLDYFIINPELPDFSVLFSKEEFDVCINATGAANVQLSFNHPAIDFSLNTSNVYNMLNAIRQYSPKCRFINLSSAAVYGNPQKLPIQEADPVQPISPYGYHKWYSEQICDQFHKLYGIDTLSLRIFSVYGEGLRKQLFWDVYQQVRNRTTNQLLLYGTGKESRDFIYIDDLCRAIETLSMQVSFKAGVINVSSGVETSIADAVQCFLQFFDRKITVHFGGEIKKGDPLNWRADIEALISSGFVPAFSIEQGLLKLAEWLKEKA